MHDCYLQTMSVMPTLYTLLYKHVYVRICMPECITDVYYYYFTIILSGVRLSPLATAATIGLLPGC
jgi:hypothetical protein